MSRADVAQSIEAASGNVELLRRALRAFTEGGLADQHGLGVLRQVFPEADVGALVVDPESRVRC